MTALNTLFLNGLSSNRFCIPWQVIACINISYSGYERVIFWSHHFSVFVSWHSSLFVFHVSSFAPVIVHFAAQLPQLRPVEVPSVWLWCPFAVSLLVSEPLAQSDALDRLGIFPSPVWNQRFLQGTNPACFTLFKYTKCGSGFERGDFKKVPFAPNGMKSTVSTTTP